MNSEETRVITNEDLERLRAEVKRYYFVYFSTLRGELASVSRPSAVPEFFGGYRSVVTILGRDGVVVAHFPSDRDVTAYRTDGVVSVLIPAGRDGHQDSYHFLVWIEEPIRNIVTGISEGQEVDIAISPGVSWGVKGFTVPQQIISVDQVNAELAWQAPWTYLLCADSNNLDYWSNPERAKREARIVLEPYVPRPESHGQSMMYEELAEVRAPGDIEEASVRGGDRGVVVEVFEEPSPALLVEYADRSGQTKALVTYSADLFRVLDVLPRKAQEAGHDLPLLTIS